MEKTYVVISSDSPNYYTDVLKEAKEKYRLLIESGHKAEIVYGTPGNYETVSRGCK